MGVRFSSRAGLALALLVALSGCASFRPEPLEKVPFLERSERQSRGGLAVAVAVPDRRETKRVFGVDLYGRGIQPVWVEIENRTDAPYWFMLHGIDPDYFSPHEASYKSRLLLRPITNDRMDEHFDGLGIVQTVGVSSAACVSLDDAPEDRVGARPPALPLAQEPVLKLGVVVQGHAFEELAAQQLGRFPPAFFCFQVQELVEIDRCVG